MSQAIIDALNAVFDARLIEHGLLEAPKGKTKGKATAKLEESADDDTPAVGFDSLKEKITNLVKAKGKDAAKEMLKKFKVEKLGDVPEAKFAKLDAELDKALEADDDAGSDDLFGD